MLRCGSYPNRPTTNKLPGGGGWGDEGVQMADSGLTSGDQDITLITLPIQISLMRVCKELYKIMGPSFSFTCALLAVLPKATSLALVV